MKSTKIGIDIQRALNQIYKRYPVLRDIVQDIHAHGGRALLIGGAVRDMILDLPVKDIDIEVHEMPLEALEALLKRFGEVSLVGKQFGVLKLHGLNIDWALPRTDKSGRKPEVTLDPHLPVKQAFARRDLTMNALGIDLSTEEVLDPFGGLQDIKQKKLRTTNPEFFIEDPLRLFRVMQFMARFEMEPDLVLNELCKVMDISQVSRERIEEEFKKLFLRSKQPSRGIRWLKSIGRLEEIMPELAATVGVEQKASYHPEGDVFEHTMQALDAAAQLSNDNSEKKLMLMYAALCHDLGKVVASRKNEDGEIISHGHDVEGVPLARALMNRICGNQDLMAGVEKLVRYHMSPIQFQKNQAKISAYKRLANKLAPQVTMAMLADLSLVDQRGRNPESSLPLKSDFDSVLQFRARSQEAKVLEQVEKPVLLGRDIMDVVEPGERMGDMIKRAYEIQIEEGIQDKDELKYRVLDEIQKNSF